MIPIKIEKYLQNNGYILVIPYNKRNTKYKEPNKIQEKNNCREFLFNFYSIFIHR